jgi:hypothetical protein
MNEPAREPHNDSRHDLYQKTRQNLCQLYLANSARRDATLLIVTCALLIFSLAAVRLVGDEHSIVALPLLCCVWGLCIGAIILTLVSLQIGQAAVAVQLKQVGKYFLDDEEESLQRANLPSIVSHLMGYLSSGVFLAAVICFVTFAGLNIPAQNSTAPEATNGRELQLPPEATEAVEDGPLENQNEAVDQVDSVDLSRLRKSIPVNS